MKKILPLLAILLLAACAKKNVQPTVTESVRYVDREVVHTIVDTVPVIIEIPSQSASVVTRDTVSRLETDYAESFAMWSDGLLTHELKNKARKVNQDVAVTHTDSQRVVERTDTIVVKDIEYITQEIGAWTKFKSRAFWWLLAVLLAAIIWIFRTPLVKVVKNWLIDRF